MSGGRDSSCGSVCQRIAMFIPVVFVLALIGWSYFAFMVAYGGVIPDLTIRIIVSILYHIFLVMFLWTYFMAIFTAPAEPPRAYFLTDNEYSLMRSNERGREVLQSVTSRITVYERTTTGAVRYCDIDKCIKPDRSHHCSMCKQCVLKMDHHCPWVGNCVGFSNYKYFVLFLHYTCLYTLFIVICCAPFIIELWNDSRTDNTLRFHVLIMFLVALVFFLTVFGLYSFHIYLLLHNKTTLESSRAPCFRGGFADAKRYNLGFYENFKQVFGKSPLFWFLPVATSVGNGYEFETRSYISTNTEY